MTVFVPVEEKQNLFCHIHTGKLYSYVPSQQGYHPVDQQGNPIICSDAADYEEGEIEIVHELGSASCKLDTSWSSYSLLHRLQ